MKYDTDHRHIRPPQPIVPFQKRKEEEKRQSFLVSQNPDTKVDILSTARNSTLAIVKSDSRSRPPLSTFDPFRLA